MGDAWAAGSVADPRPCKRSRWIAAAAAATVIVVSSGIAIGLANSRQTIEGLSCAIEPHIYLLGDETAQSWPVDGAYFDGTSYYWSTENPSKNAQGRDGGGPARHRGSRRREAMVRSLHRRLQQAAAGGILRAKARH